MLAQRRRRLIAAGFAIVLVTTVCAEPMVPVIEDLWISRDSIAIQLRDTLSTLVPTPVGKLGFAVDVDVTWRSKDPSVVEVVKDGQNARLIPRGIGQTEVEAQVQGRVAKSTVRVLDTVYSITVTATDTIVSAGQRLRYSATVNGPPGASTAVVWSVKHPRVAAIERHLTDTSAEVISLDTGVTDVIAMSAIDRSHTATARFRTAKPVALYFATQTPQPPKVNRVGDALQPGPVVSILDELGNEAPFASASILMSLEPPAGASGVRLAGTLLQPAGSSGARFQDLRLDGVGAGFKLTASAPGFTSVTSLPFDVSPACGGTPYVLEEVVNATVTTSSCQADSTTFYNAHIVTMPNQAFFHLRKSNPDLRLGIVFPDGTQTRPIAANSDSVFVLAGPGTYALRVYSGANGATGSYQLSSLVGFPQPMTFAASGIPIIRVQTHVGVVYQDVLRRWNLNPSCGVGGSTNDVIESGYRLHLPANRAATITASSSTIDPCLNVDVPGIGILRDDNSGGGTTAKVVVPTAPVDREVLVSVVGPFFGTGAAYPFTLRIQP